MFTYETPLFIVNAPNAFIGIISLILFIIAVVIICFAATAWLATIIITLARAVIRPKKEDDRPPTD
jgi:hypothetical protein